MRTFIVTLLVALAAAAASCNKSGGGGSTPTGPGGVTTSVTGTWNATRAEFVNISNSSQRVEVISQGTKIVLLIDQAGTGTMTSTTPGEPPFVITFRWAASGNELTLTWTSVWVGQAQFDMALTANAMSIAGGHLPFDVNGDDIAEESILSMALTRQ